MKKRIYIKDWLTIKPYDNHSVTDSYYLGVSNNILKILQDKSIKKFLDGFLYKEEFTLLACLLTSYFEDIISETKLFTTFRNKHEALYGKKLPFVVISDNYIDNEINEEDIYFLLWYFISSLNQNKYFINPHHFILKMLAFKIMQVFEEEYEYAPINEELQQFYAIDKKEENFYLARQYMDKILFNSYLFYTDCYIDFYEEQKKTIKDYAEDTQRLIDILKDQEDRAVLSTYTKLLSMRGNEWAAEILGKNHPLYHDFLSMSKKVQGFFLYKGQDKVTIFLEHIASGRQFNLTKKSLESTNDFKNIDDIVYIGIVKWKDEWWFSGVMVVTVFDADRVLEEKNSIPSRAAVNFLDYKKKSKEINETLTAQFEIFKKFSKGKQIMFLSPEDADKFTNNFIEYYNKSLNLLEVEKEKAIKKAKEEGFFGGEKDDMLATNLETGFESAVLFFNPKSGLETVYNINSAFPVKENPFYDEKNSKSHFLKLFADKGVSKELVMFCVDNYRKEFVLIGDSLVNILISNTDFLLRFYKMEEYHTAPKITFTGDK